MSEEDPKFLIATDQRAAIKSFEVMPALKNGQGSFFHFLPSIAGKVSLVHRTFGLT